MPINQFINLCSDVWSSFMLNALIDGVIILAIISAIWLIIHKRASAQLGYGLFLLVLLKIIVPVEFAVPLWVSYCSPRNAVEQVVQWSTVDIGESMQLQTDAMTLQSTQYPPDVSVNSFTQNTPTITFASAPTAETKAPATPLTTKSKIMVVWLTVVLILLLWFLWVQKLTRDILKASSHVDPESLPVNYQKLRKLAGVSKDIPIYENSIIASPAIWGVQKPFLILPADLKSTMTGSQLSWILLHELSHIRRYDLWVSFIQRIIQIVFFFHPAVWIANWAVNQLREYACDDAALAACDASRSDCGEGFLNLVERANASGITNSLALGLFNPGTLVRRRLLRILDASRVVRQRISLSAGIGLVLAAVVLLPVVRADIADTSSDAALESPDNGTYQFRGVVSGEIDGVPIPDAQVTLYISHERWMPYQKTEHEIIARVKTDESGEFLFEDIPAGKYKFHITAKGHIDYRPQGFSQIVNPHERILLGANHPVVAVDVKMQTGRVAKIHVVDSNGAPVSGAQIFGYFSEMNMNAPHDVTDKNGFCTIDTLMDKPGFFHVSHESNGETYSSIFNPGSIDEPAEIQVVMSEPLKLRGRVIMKKDDQPAKDVKVYAMRDMNDKRVINDIPDVKENVALTDEDGFYEFTNLGAGEYRISAGNYREFNPKFRYYSGYIKVELRSGEEPTLEHLLVDYSGGYSEISSKVIDLSGNPIKNARIIVDVEKAQSSLGFAETNEYGEFHCTNIRPWVTLKLEISAENQITYKQVISKDNIPSEIVLQSAAIIKGKVVDAETGRPVSGAVVHALELGGRWDQRASASSGEDLFTFSGVDGSFTLKNVNDISIKLNARADGYTKSTLHRFHLNANQVEEGVVIKLTPGITFKGVILDPKGNPLSGAIIGQKSKAINPNENTIEFHEHPTFPGVVRSTEDGSFQIKAVDAKGDVLFIKSPSYAVKRFKIRKDLLSGDVIPITMTKGGTLEGTVNDHEEKPLQGARIAVLNYPENLLTYETFTDVNGRYRIENMALGKFFVRKNYSTRENLNNHERRTIEVKEGETAYAGFGAGSGAVVYGTVYANGKPSPNAKLTIKQDDIEHRFGYSLTTKSKDDGSFRFKGIPQGEWVVSFVTQEKLNSQEWMSGGEMHQPISVSSAQGEYKIDIHAQAYKLIVTAQDAESGELLRDVSICWASHINRSIPSGVNLHGKTDEKGIAEIEIKAPINYELMAFKDGYAAKIFNVNVKPLSPGESFSTLQTTVELSKTLCEMQLHVMHDGAPFDKEEFHVSVIKDEYRFPYSAKSIEGKPGQFLINNLLEGECTLLTHYFNNKGKNILMAEPEKVYLTPEKKNTLLIKLYPFYYCQILLHDEDGMVEKGCAKIEIEGYPKLSAFYEKTFIRKNNLLAFLPLERKKVRVIVPGYLPADFNMVDVPTPVEIHNAGVIRLYLEKE
jgi:beta-lactamase regulating signal transducer with metallopeptidase domain/uncharacterized GH25 family protein